MRNHNVIHTHSRFSVGVAAALTGLALTACGSSGSGSGASSTPAASSGASSSTGAIATKSTSLGRVLVDAHGRTIYYFAADHGSTSECNGACATNWPPVPAPSSMTSPSGVSDTLGSTTRSDGMHQLTVDGHPVYTFVGDSAPGQANGQGKVLNGGLWTVISPSGAAITGGASGSSSAYQQSNGY